MLKKVLLVLAVVVVAFLGFVATRPATYHVERSVVISAPAAVVFPFLNSHKEFVLWSPWQNRDPNQKMTFTGPESGVGAAYAWAGNDQVGSGSSTITESKPNEHVKLDLEFLEPFASKSKVTYTLVPEGEGGTKVTWGMDGNNDFAGKLFGLFMNMDTMLGQDFTEGLVKLKVLAQTKAKDAQAQAAPVPLGVAPPAPGVLGDGGPEAASPANAG